VGAHPAPAVANHFTETRSRGCERRPSRRRSFFADDPKWCAHFQGQHHPAHRAAFRADDEFDRGRFGALATASGHADTAKLLRQVVEVDDPVSGTVRLKPVVADADEMALDTRSTKTIRSRPA